MWPNADANVRTGFGAMRIEGMTTTPVEPGVSGIWSFSGNEIIKVRLNTTNNYSSSEVVDTLDANQKTWQYYDIDAAAYYV